MLKSLANFFIFNFNKIILSTIFILFFVTNQMIAEDELIINFLLVFTFFLMSFFVKNLLVLDLESQRVQIIKKIKLIFNFILKFLFCYLKQNFIFIYLNRYFELFFNLCNQFTSFFFFNIKQIQFSLFIFFIFHRYIASNVQLLSIL